MELSHESFAQTLVKYAIEGLAVAIAVNVIPKQALNTEEVALIALTAGATFLVLDTFAPSVAMGVRKGSGFGIGLKQVGIEGFHGGASTCGPDGGCGGANSQCSCGACLKKLGASDPGMNAYAYSVSCPADPLSVTHRSSGIKNAQVAPFGVQGEFKSNNMKVRNYFPGYGYFKGLFA